jgi:hypothetical protein
MEAGSLEAVAYAFFQLVDEILHALDLDRFEWACNFCQWAHRKDQEAR